MTASSAYAEVSVDTVTENNSHASVTTTHGRLLAAGDHECNTA
jgi:hypothetical protein